MVRLLLLGLNMKTKTKANKQILLLASAILLTVLGCSKSATEFTPIVPPAEDMDAQIVTDGKCVQVFYDKTTDPNYTAGRSYALMLLNLLGHFPEYQQVTGPIELYKKGDLERCHASFYIGSFYNNALPAAFIGDYLSTTRRVVWIGYSIWQLGLEFENAFGYSSNVSFTGLDNTNKTPDGKPSFFRDILYKGETFTKYGQWKDATKTTFVASPEMIKFQSKLSDKATVMATAKHSFSNEILPWALKTGNKFYVAEIPFSYVHEGDRYLVFADLLFDFLDQKPKNAKKYAVLRLEDVNPMSDQALLDRAVGLVKKNAVVPHIAITPIYETPTQTIRMENSPLFLNLMERYSEEGSVFIWHGNKYPYVTSTAAMPMAEILGNLEDGFKSLKQARIAPKFWTNPNHTASTLDNIATAKTFEWNVGRGVFIDTRIKPMKTPPVDLTFDLNETTRAQARVDYLSKVVATDSGNNIFFGQFFPFEIYGNQYGQRMIPENLGNVTPGTRNVAAILADAKRNLVLRDIWASMYYHPYLLSGTLNPENANPAVPTDLENAITGLKALGYEFVNIKEFSAATTAIGTVGARVELENSRK